MSEEEMVPTRETLEAECERLSRILADAPDTSGFYFRVEAMLEAAEQRLREYDRNAHDG